MSFGSFNFGQSNFNGAGSSSGVPQYPTPAIGGPGWTAFYDLEPIYPTLVQPFQSGGADYNLDDDGIILRWYFTYQFLLEIEADMLDSHYRKAKGQTFDFDFRHPRTGVLYHNVRYDDGFKVEDRQHKWLLNRTVYLIQRPE